MRGMQLLPMFAVLLLLEPYIEAMQHGRLRGVWRAVGICKWGMPMIGMMPPCVHCILHVLAYVQCSMLDLLQVF